MSNDLSKYDCWSLLDKYDFKKCHFSLGNQKRTFKLYFLTVIVENFNVNPNPNETYFQGLGASFYIFSVAKSYIGIFI